MNLSRIASLVTALLVPASAFAETPLPADLKVVAPAPEVAKELAAFSGKWSGLWMVEEAEGLEHQLVVEKIEGRIAHLVYSYGDGPKWGISANYVRYLGEFQPDGSLRTQLRNGAMVNYRMSADASSLDGEWAGRRTLRGVFKRAPAQ